MSTEAPHRDHLPQLDGGLFLTDGGIETTLIFHRGLDLPEFAAFILLDDERGTDELRRYYQPYLELAAERSAGFVLESPTWRASPKWASRLGHDDDQLDVFNRKAIALMEELREAYRDRVDPIVISGCIGPQADAYAPEEILDAEASREYHSTQIGTFADTAADMVTAVTMTYVDEAVGIAEAAKAAGMPVAISFTVETDGRLPSGQSLDEAIEELDERTGSAAGYLMLNCAHPTHFDEVLDAEAPWAERIHGLRANASTRSHAELDEAEDLDAGDPADLGARYAGLATKLPRLNVVGGCCGTDERHLSQIAASWPS
jgi:S-methylmethionine-dependent homocysteine/selenocysteine methylase